MFGLFGKKKNEIAALPVTREDKEWIEKSFLWLGSKFGFGRVKSEPFVLPISNNYPYENLYDNGQLLALFRQVCEGMEINADEINLVVFDDIEDQQWYLIRSGDQPLGTYSELEGQEGKKYKIELAKSMLEDKLTVITTITHELAHVKLLGNNLMNVTDADMEYLTDLSCIFFGYGLFLANDCYFETHGWSGKRGYLQSELIAYANALMCYIAKRSRKEIEQYLNKNTLTHFRNASEYLEQTKDTLLHPEQVEQTHERYLKIKRLDDAFDAKEYNTAMEILYQLTKEEEGKEWWTWNDLGYAKLMLGRYEEAIEDFTKAIEIDRYQDYPINNRGFCYLQLGMMEDAQCDIFASYEMNPGNPFSLRNVGLFHLAEGNHADAISFLEKALAADPLTESINHYLSMAYRASGKVEKAEQYMLRSEERKEAVPPAVGKS